MTGEAGTTPLERAITAATPTSSAEAPRTWKQESYSGPATGRTRRRLGPRRELDVRMTLRASSAGEGAHQGDLWLEFEPVTKSGRPGRGRPLRFRLDIGAKRFLFSQLEQALTLGDFARGV